MLTSLFAQARAVLAAFVMLIGLAAPAYAIGVTVSAGQPVAELSGPYAGTGPWTYEIYNGTAPAGLSVAPASPGSNYGLLSGSATEVGSFSFSVRARDTSNNVVGGVTYEMTVSAPTLTLSPPAGTLNAQQGQAYSQSYTAGGGNAPYTYEIAAGSLPAGLTLSSYGLLSGIPSVSGLFTFSVRVRDTTTGPGEPYSRTQNYVMQVVAKPTISASSVSADEGDSGATAFDFPVTLSNASTSTVTVNWQTSPATATAGVDYVTASGTVTFAPGETSKTITVLVNGDTVHENDETFLVHFGAVTNATVAGNSTTIYGTIQNDDPEPTISIDNMNAYEGNSGTTPFNVTVTLSNASASTVTVNYATGGGTATPGADYTPTSGTLTFLPGETTKTITVLVIGDTVYELNQAFLVQLSDATNASLVGGGGVMIILNDEAPPTLVVDDVSASEAAGTMTFTVTRTGATEVVASVDYATADGTAVAPGDYTATSGTLAFTPSLAATATRTFTVDLANDNVYEATEQFAVNLSNANFAASIADSQGLGTITDDDPAPTIAINDVSVSEGAGNAIFTVTLTGATALPISVNYATADGTAVSPGDYSATSGTLTFNPSTATSQTLTIVVPLNNDATNEATEQFALNLSGPTNGATLSDAQGVATITDDDAVPTLSINDVSAAEGNSGTTNFVFTVTLTGASAQTATVNYATADGTANAGSDYVAGSGTLTFAPGVTAQTVTVAVNGDFLVEPDEQFALNLSGPTNATIADGQGVGTIQNDDAAVTISPASGALPGAQAAVAYTQQLTGTGGNGGPYTFSLQVGSLPPGLTLTSDGLISGTLTATGTYNFTVTVSDTVPNIGSAFYSITVSSPTIVIDLASLPNATQFSAYSQTLTASGGNAPYTFSVSAGTLPAGLTLNPATGELSGTPTAFGSFTFTATATDSTSGGTYTGNRVYTLVVNQAQPTIASVAPNLGPTAGGQLVTITGTNFANASAVTFGGTTATGFSVNSPTSITATAPAHASGTVDVVVTTPGGTATATNGYVYENPGAVRFVVNAGDDDGSFVFSSLTTGLNFTIATSGGSGQSANIALAPGSYALSFTTPAGFGIASASCSPAASTVNAAARTASLVIASNVTTVCTIEALGARRATTEMIGAALDAQSRLILSNAPSVSRRLDRLNGRSGGVGGTASAFGKTFASNLPFSAALSEGQFTFAMSLSDLRARSDADHRFVRPDGIPASLAASAEPVGGLAATSAAAATTQLEANRTYRFDAWVEGTIARFEGAASSNGDFAILHAGADYLISDHVLLGVGIQGDWLNMDTASGSLESSGWLAGPYLTARLTEGLYLDLRAAWGGASFDVSPFGTYTDTVESDRELYSAALIGEFTSGALTLRPEARVTWYKEETDAYVDSLSVAIPSVEIKTGEVTFGPTFAWNIKQASGATLVPSIGLDLIWTFQQDNTATQFTGAPGLDDTGLRGRIQGGLAWQAENGVSIGGSLFYDGIGGGDYEAWGGKAALRFGF